MKAIRFLSLMAAIGWLVAACDSRKDAIHTRIPAERIAYAYHGMLLDEDLKEITLDSRAITEMQDSMIDELLKRNDDTASKSVAALLDELSRTGNVSPHEVLLVKNGIIGKLLDQAPGDLRALYTWRYRLLRSRAWSLTDPPVARLRPEISELLPRYAITDFYIFPDLVYFNYGAQCRSRRVPIPPDWPDARWVFRDDLKPQFNFIGSGETKVYTYNDANGVCFALPRSEGVFMGIICQSESTGKACFWDNLYATGARIDWRTSPLVVANLQNGSNLAENCTQCHRGRNVFLIHPDSALTVSGLDTDPTVRYSPLGQNHWENSGPLVLPQPAAGQSSCSGCHEFPNVTVAFCKLLEQAANTTMPPGGPPAGWSSPRAAYKDHISFLKSRCGSTCFSCHAASEKELLFFKE